MMMISYTTRDTDLMLKWQEIVNYILTSSSMAIGFLGMTRKWTGA